MRYSFKLGFPTIEESVGCKICKAVRRTNKIPIVWRAFAKKHNFNLDFFRHEYIVHRFQDKKIMREQFRITPEEMKMCPSTQK